MSLCINTHIKLNGEKCLDSIFFFWKVSQNINGKDKRRTKYKKKTFLVLYGYPFTYIL